MIESVKDLENIFKEIDSKLKTKTTAYLIGGGALMFFGLKNLTKDIDLVVKSEPEYRSIYSSIKSIGYKETALTDGIQRLNISAAMQRVDFRIDLFLNKICGKMEFSDSMALRAKPLFQGKNLSISFASKEDVFVFKTITDRVGDKTDCEAILNQNPDWSIILKEILFQSKKGEAVWITYINERLIEFEEKGYKIPIQKQTGKETKKFYEKLEKSKKKLEKK
jgi:hypothetical protein